jgi:hypothetical protein
MAHPTTSEASTPVSAEAVQDFIAEQFLGGADEPAPEEEEQELPEGEEPEGETDEAPEAESDEEPNEEDSEAPEPIAPPVSWDKDAKELFQQLPHELQQKVVEREAQRDKAVQQATTEAANAKRTASVEANQALAEYQRQYASHLEQIASQYAPQPPDPALAAQDPGRYIALKAQFDADYAQYHTVIQQSAQARSEAEQRDALTRQHEITKDQEVLASQLGDDWTDMSRRKELLTSLETVGAELGYPMDLMSQANATDILALKAAAEWKAKAEKYDALQKNKMAAVRAAKDAPRVSKPGTASTQAERSSRQRNSAWDAVKASKGKSGDAAAAYLESIGLKL